MMINIKLCPFLVLLVLVGAPSALPQTESRSLKPILEQSLQSPALAEQQLREYLMRKVPPLPRTSTAAQWTTEARRLRQKYLDEVVFRGWPKEWVNAPLKVEDMGLIPSGDKRYRMRKLRYEIVPGFQSAAILYEPAVIQGKMPAVLNVNGHLPPGGGKAVEYKQKRCINQALMGMFALNIDWLWYGELSNPDNAHAYSAHLDLAGASGVGLFYLSMRKGLDYLAQRPDVDPSRLGVTGLSGGGWQTIVLSALDERVAASVPVAGYSAFVSRLERVPDIGDTEQNPTDMLTVLDYPHLTAMRAPRPTLLIYNAEDDCCFRAPLVKPYIFDAIKPFFRLYGHEDRLEWHENTDPSTHNYQVDNRLQAYRFFARAFGLPIPEAETDVAAQVKTSEELTVGLPNDNMTVLGLARKLAGRIERASPPSRDGLKSVTRYQPVSIRHAWAAGNTKSKGVETRSYRFEFNDGLSATGIWLKPVSSSAAAPSTIVLNDEGKKAAGVEIAERVNRGEQVLVVDLVFTGEEAPPPHIHTYAQLVAAAGDRPLGIEAAQLIGLAHWFEEAFGGKAVRLESSGMRSQVTALVASALEPGTFSSIVVREGIPSFRFLLDKPVPYSAAPDLFCFGFYKDFDIDRLAMLSAPVQMIPR